MLSWYCFCFEVLLQLYDVNEAAKIVWVKAENHPIQFSTTMQLNVIKDQKFLVKSIAQTTECQKAWGRYSFRCGRQVLFLNWSN